MARLSRIFPLVHNPPSFPCDPPPNPYPRQVTGYLLERQLAPELARLSSVLSNVGTLAVELVVLGSGKLLGALGAVVAAAGAGRGAGKCLAGRGAGEGSSGEHGDVCSAW